jgi:hypothetical protein
MVKVFLSFHSSSFCIKILFFHNNVNGKATVWHTLCSKESPGTQQNPRPYFDTCIYDCEQCIFVTNFWVIFSHKNWIIFRKKKFSANLIFFKKKSEKKISDFLTKKIWQKRQKEKKDCEDRTKFEGHITILNKICINSCAKQSPSFDGSMSVMTHDRTTIHTHKSIWSSSF